MWTTRITLPGFDVFTDTNPDHFALLTDQSNVLIKEKARGTILSNYTDRSTIAHGLSYIPACLVWGEDTSGNIILQRISNAFSFSNMWVETIDTTNLYIDNGMGNNLHAFYYIFYDFVVSGSPTFSNTGMQMSISKPGINVLTDTNPNNYIFHSNLNTFKIVLTGTVNITSSAGIDVLSTITHNLGKRNGFLLIWTDPHFAGLVQFHDNNNGFYHVDSGSGTVIADTSYFVTGTNSLNNLVIDYFDTTGGLTTTVRYYIFENTT